MNTVVGLDISKGKSQVQAFLDKNERLHTGKRPFLVQLLLYKYACLLPNLIKFFKM
ncbi:hypothetical protein [Peribacillus frigoritolerans]|uniref:hypothetical protein n=1 Tax=Peribacillus frigoritolerans TaxID=450367 RepID=UPI0039A1F56C